MAAYAGNLRSDSSSPVFPVTPTCSETGPGVAAEVTGLGSHSDKRNTRSSINTKDKVEAEVNVKGRQTGKRRKRKMDVEAQVADEGNQRGKTRKKTEGEVEAEADVVVPRRSKRRNKH